jgi:uncharacterized protein (TIGR02284 family)
MPNTTISTLNSLLRGELSAIETYEQALAKLGASMGAGELRQIQSEHREAAAALRAQIQEHGGQPDQGSGAWGAFARTVEGTAKLFGAHAALKALKEGEEHGIKQYEAALRDQNFPRAFETEVAGRLLPRARAHLAALDRMIAGLVQRISPQDARQHLEADSHALLVCAYDSPEKYEQNHLEGSISLADFKVRAGSIPKTTEVIFYCA